MDQERGIRRDREAAATPGTAYPSTQYARSGVDAMGAGGGAPRSTMGKHFPGMMAGGTMANLRRPHVMDSDGYARRSEPALSKGEIPRFEAKRDATDAHFELMRLRRSMPSASHGGMAEDLAWAHESIKQSEHRSTSASSSSGSSSGPTGILSRGLTAHTSDGNSGKPSAYQLQRAHTADVVQRTDGQAIGDMSLLRQQVTLLRRSLEEEKKRRVMEQKLMQDKILELQGLIRHNMPEQKRELERNLNAMRTPSGKQSGQSLQKQQQLQQQQQQAAQQQQQQQASATTTPARVRAMRNSVHLQQAQERSPYKTMKLLSEICPEQMELDDGTDEEIGDIEEEGEDDDDEEEEEEEEEEDEDEEENVPGVEDPDLGETKARRKSDGEQSSNNGNNNKETSTSAAVRAVETRMAQELTKLRARMRAVVLEAQNEVKTLKQRLDDDHKIHERKERQLRMESSLRVTSLEERHNYAKKKLLGKTSLLSTQVAMLTDENQKMLQEAKVKDERIRQLELALGGRRIVMDSTKPHQQKSNPQQQS